MSSIKSGGNNFASDNNKQNVLLYRDSRFGENKNIFILENIFRS